MRNTLIELEAEAFAIYQKIKKSGGIHRSQIDTAVCNEMEKLQLIYIEHDICKVKDGFGAKKKKTEKVLNIKNPGEILRAFLDEADKRASFKIEKSEQAKYHINELISLGFGDILMEWKIKEITPENINNNELKIFCEEYGNSESVDIASMNWWNIQQGNK